MRRFIKHILASLFAFFSLTVSITFVLYSTEFFFFQTSWRPNEVSIQIIRFILILVVLGFISAWMSPVMKVLRRGSQTNILEPINKALKQIAMGNFDIQLDAGSFENSPVGKIISDINFAANELSKLEVMRQEFISNVSHEIQSPLTSINGFAKALKDFDLSEEDRTRYLNIIVQESERLSKISANLLKLTALESEQQTVEWKVYSLDKQLVHCVLSCEPRWLEKNINMDVNLDKITLEGDEDLMSQVWINILSNSIKFTPNNGTIGIKATVEGLYAIVEVEDTGIGLSEEEKERIFERFYKADHSRTATIGGSGLGLSIAKKIIELHRGEVTVKSDLGKGTKFILKIPLYSSFNQENSSLKT